MDFDLLTDIIDAYKQYQLTQPPGKKSTLAEFGVWINEQQGTRALVAAAAPPDNAGDFDINVELGKLIIYLNRYARLIIKKGLAGFPELISEDFTYLYILMTEESMTKIQMIEKNVHEKPSGLEVIKRLLKHGLLTEKKDDNDKRSMRVSITDKGRATFFRTLETMSKVARLIAGNLTPDEKSQLYNLLKKLEDFHNPIFLHERATILDDMLHKLP